MGELEPRELGLGLTLDGLEVVDDGDAQAGDGVQDGEHHDVQGEGAKQRLSRGGRGAVWLGVGRVRGRVGGWGAGSGG